MRTINDFNREYEYQSWLHEVEAANRPRRSTAIQNAIFYSILLMLVTLVFLRAGSSGFGKRIGPFAYNTVLTASMNSVYRQGSLIVSWAVKPDEPLTAGLQNGTDIVFTTESGTAVVHRIIDIFENYEDSGQRAFRTQGVDNPAPDAWITYEGNVIGRVIWHLPYAGSALALIADNFILTAAAVVIIFTVITLLKSATKKKP